MIVSALRELYPVGNPVKISIQSSNHLEQVGVFASLSFGFVTAGNDGQTFTLKLGLGVNLEFIFKDNPLEDGYQLQAYQTGMSFFEWFVEMIAGLRSNYYLANYYTITEDVANGIVTIAAKEAGYSFNIDFDAVPAYINNNVAIKGQEEIQKANFSIHARVLDADNNVLGYDRIAGNQAVFDFSDYLYSLVESAIYFPEIADQYPLPNSNACKEFYIEYWETAQDYQSAVKKTESALAVCGGVNKTHEALIDRNLKTFLELFKSADLLVQTARPTQSRISLNQPLHFYFINNLEDGSKTFTISIELNYTDGTSSYFDSGQSIAVDEWQQGVLFLSPGIHNLEDEEPAKQIKNIRAQIEANSGEVSEVFEFVPYDSAFEQILVCKNSFGTYDYLPFFGITTIQDKYSREIFESSDNEVSLLDSSENENQILNSGWMSKDQRDWMRDLLLSREVYLIKENILESYIITTTEPIRHKDKDYLYSLTIKLQKSMSDRYYSRERNEIGETAGGIVIGTGNLVIGTGNIVIGA